MIVLTEQLLRCMSTETRQIHDSDRGTCPAIAPKRGSCINEAKSHSPQGTCPDIVFSNDA